MRRKKTILYPVLFMMIITAIYTMILASVNAISAPRIAMQDTIKTEQSILYVNNLPYNLDNTALQASFDQNFNSVNFHNRTYYTYKENGVIKSYTLPFSGSGLWGTIRGYLAVSGDFSEIIGLDFTSHSETPGLGGRIEELWFKEQFRGLTLTDAPYIVYKSEDPNSQIDAITGATLTSKSVKNMLNNFIEEIKSHPEEVVK